LLNVHAITLIFVVFRKLIWLNLGADGKYQIYTGTMDGGSVSLFLSSKVIYKPSAVQYDEYAER